VCGRGGCTCGSRGCTRGRGGCTCGRGGCACPPHIYTHSPSTHAHPPLPHMYTRVNMRRKGVACLSYRMTKVIRFLTIFLSWSGCVSECFCLGGSIWAVRIVLQIVRSLCSGGMQNRALSKKWYFSRYSSYSLWTSLVCGWYVSGVWVVCG